MKPKKIKFRENPPIKNLSKTFIPFRSIFSEKAALFRRPSFEKHYSFKKPAFGPFCLFRSLSNDDEDCRFCL